MNDKVTFQVICSNKGCDELCNGCGAAVLHDHNSCEPCPIDNKSHCVAVAAFDAAFNPGFSEIDEFPKMWTPKLTKALARQLGRHALDMPIATSSIAAPKIYFHQPTIEIDPIPFKLPEHLDIDIYRKPTSVVTWDSLQCMNFATVNKNKLRKQYRLRQPRKMKKRFPVKFYLSGVVVLQDYAKHPRTISPLKRIIYK